MSNHLKIFCVLSTAHCVLLPMLVSFSETCFRLPLTCTRSHVISYELVFKQAPSALTLSDIVLTHSTFHFLPISPMRCILRKHDSLFAWELSAYTNCSFQVLCICIVRLQFLLLSQEVSSALPPSLTCFLVGSVCCLSRLFGHHIEHLAFCPSVFNIYGLQKVCVTFTFPFLCFCFGDQWIQLHSFRWSTLRKRSSIPFAALELIHPLFPSICSHLSWLFYAGWGPFSAFMPFAFQNVYFVGCLSVAVCIDWYRSDSIWHFYLVIIRVNATSDVFTFIANTTNNRWTLYTTTFWCCKSSAVVCSSFKKTRLFPVIIWLFGAFPIHQDHCPSCLSCASRRRSSSLSSTQSVLFRDRKEAVSGKDQTLCDVEMRSHSFLASSCKLFITLFTGGT